MAFWVTLYKEDGIDSTRVYRLSDIVRYVRNNNKENKVPKSAAINWVINMGFDDFNKLFMDNKKLKKLVIKRK